ncbi:MAG: fimbrillin family protein, partial [Duncaniella sp.]|nr:fimbrillin family protein [Duncaniella sp.]
MKKHLFSLALGVMTLTACTSEEVVDVSPTQGNAIGFENIVDKNARAIEGDLTTSTFDNFMVYGYYTKEGMTTPVQIFNGVPVSKVNNKWSYDGVRYWVPKCTYFFYAYSCADIALTVGKGSPALTLTNETTVDGRALAIMGYLCDGTHQHDLVYAEKEGIIGSEKDNPQVALEFKHALCKMKAVFTTDFPAGYQVKISNVRISEFDSRGDFNVGTGAWKNHKSDPDAYINLAVDENKNTMTNAPGSSVETAEIFLIPKQYPGTEFVKLHFSIELTKDGEVVLQRNITGAWSPQWEGAHVYRYNIN